jgi:hypothetical protein
MADFTPGLIHGLQQGISSYFDASEKRKDREMKQQMLDLQQSQRSEDQDIGFYEKGLIPKRDESGKIIGAGVNEEYFKAKSDADPITGLLKTLQVEKAKNDINDAAKKKTPEGKIEAMSGEQKKRFDHTVGARNAVTDLSDAYKTLDITGDEDLLGSVKKRSQMAAVPFRGDTPYTQALTRFEEYLGRLQSGGMIGKDEAARFRKMVPTSFDNPKIGQKKLQDMTQELEASISTSGVKPEEAEAMGLLRRQESPAPSKVKVSNGKETLLISPQDLKDAQKDGFQVME